MLDKVVHPAFGDQAEYTGESIDSLRYTEVTLTEEQVMKNAKPLLGEKMDKLALHGLPPSTFRTRLLHW